MIGKFEMADGDDKSKFLAASYAWSSRIISDSDCSCLFDVASKSIPSGAVAQVVSDDVSFSCLSSVGDCWGDISVWRCSCNS